MQFIMDYPLDGKKLNHYLDFYITNLKYACNFLLLFVVVCCCLLLLMLLMFSVLLCSYGEQSGRESVIELLAAIFNKFPEVCHHTITGLTCFVP